MCKTIKANKKVVNKIEAEKINMEYDNANSILIDFKEGYLFRHNNENDKIFKLSYKDNNITHTIIKETDEIIDIETDENGKEINRKLYKLVK